MYRSKPADLVNALLGEDDVTITHLRSNGGVEARYHGKNYILNIKSSYLSVDEKPEPHTATSASPAVREWFVTMLCGYLISEVYKNA